MQRFRDLAAAGAGPRRGGPAGRRAAAPAGAGARRRLRPRPGRRGAGSRPGTRSSGWTSTRCSIAAAEADHPGPTWLVGDLAELDLPARGIAAGFDAHRVRRQRDDVPGTVTRAGGAAPAARHLAPGGRAASVSAPAAATRSPSSWTTRAPPGWAPDLLLATWDLRPFTDGRRLPRRAAAPGRPGRLIRAGRRDGLIGGVARGPRARERVSCPSARRGRSRASRRRGPATRTGQRRAAGRAPAATAPRGLARRAGARVHPRRHAPPSTARCAGRRGPRAGQRPSCVRRLARRQPDGEQLVAQHVGLLRRSASTSHGCRRRTPMSCWCRSATAARASPPSGRRPRSGGKAGRTASSPPARSSFTPRRPTRRRSRRSAPRAA